MTVPGKGRPACSRRALELLLIGLLAASAGCGSEEVVHLFSTDVDEIVIEVDYQEGAAPYTQENVWALFTANAHAVFAASPREIRVPSALSEMELMEGVTQREFTTPDLVELSRTYRDAEDTLSRRVFHVMFLDGYLANDGKRSKDVIGVSIEGTTIIVLFKPVVRDATNAVFVEQSSLVHEFGHAVGLVNLDLPLTSPHHDAEHGAHCTNRDCVMYYLHEGRADLLEFYRRYLQTKSPLLFGPECLDDALAAAR